MTHGIMTHIVFAVFSMLIGNLCTTILYRLPRSIPIGGFSTKHMPPSCSYCHVKLKFYQYLPPFSWTSYRCFSCKAKINPLYYFLEISATILGATYYCMTDVNTAIIILIYTMSMLLSLSLYIDTKRIYYSLVFTSFWLGLISSLSRSNDLISLLPSISLAAFIYMLANKKKKLSNDTSPLILPLGTYATCYQMLIIAISFFMLRNRIRQDYLALLLISASIFLLIFNTISRHG